MNARLKLQPAAQEPASCGPTMGPRTTHSRGSLSYTVGTELTDSLTSDETAQALSPAQLSAPGPPWFQFSQGNRHVH